MFPLIALTVDAEAPLINKDGCLMNSVGTASDFRRGSLDIPKCEAVSVSVSNQAVK